MASGLLLEGLIPGLKRLNAWGALLARAVMSGTVSFHLFTPLGIDPNAKGGGLFAAAVTIWFTALALIAIRWNELVGLARDVGALFYRRAPQGLAYSASAHAFTR